MSVLSSTLINILCYFVEMCKSIHIVCSFEFVDIFCLNHVVDIISSESHGLFVK